MTMTSLHDAAVTYARDGFEVFPLNADKTPKVSQYSATDDPEQVSRWWQSWPGALIGCRLPENVMAVDIDPRHGGDAVWTALLDLYGPAPATRCHNSGRNDGGFHLWFQRPPGKLSAKALNDWAQERGLGEPIADGAKWTAGIDILHHTHRYTILPPSPHPETGEPYTWANDGDILTCPGWLVELITEAERAPEPPRATTSTYSGPSVADWFTQRSSWRSILEPHGWQCVGGDGDSDGSKWRHPSATNSFSATIRHGCLFVYSPNTPFDETTDGDANGYTRFRALAVLEHHGDLSAAARYAGGLPGAPDLPDSDLTWFIEANRSVDEQPSTEPPLNPLGAWRIDWGEFWTTDHKAEDFICAPILARGRGHAIYAKAKTGKSLVTLEMAAALATGRPFLGKPQSDPVSVLYVDYEMTGDDIHERLEAFGYGPDDDLEHLHYVQLPAIDPLDTKAGGEAVVTAAAMWGAQVVVVDTTARSVQGEENAMETFRDFYRHTFMPLKQAGVTTLRVDHAGKDAERGQRGSSAKNDDVDVVWELTVKGDPSIGDQTLTLKATHRRMGWIPQSVEMVRTDEGAPMHRLAAQAAPTYVEGTAEMAAELEDAGVPLDAGRRVIRRDYGISGTDRLLADAQRWRKEQRTLALSARMKGRNVTESDAPPPAKETAQIGSATPSATLAPPTKPQVTSSRHPASHLAPPSKGEQAPPPHTYVCGGAPPHPEPTDEIDPRKLL